MLGHPLRRREVKAANFVRFMSLGILGALVLAVGIACAGGGEKEAATEVGATRGATPGATLTPTSPQVAATTASRVVPPHDKPGPVAERLFFSGFHVDRAPLELRKGSMDLYNFGLKVAAVSEVSDDPEVRLYEAPATMLSILLNPAPAPPDKLNPFSIKEVRQAFQLLLNRDFVVQEIFGGRAVPMLTQVSPLDFDYLNIFDLVHKSGIRYTPEEARRQIKEAMEDAGAKLVDGTWQYKDRPVRLKFIIRVEDERRELGDLLTGELEKAGFRVERVYRPFAPAIFSVYSSDPKAFEWHLYTEGWGRGSAERYDFASINQMAAPWLGNMPGWREVGFWQYENDVLDEIGKKIFTGQFQSQDERDQLYRQATEMALDESVRVWVVNKMDSFPARRNLLGVTEDLVAGPKSIWTLREAFIEGEDEITVGSLWVWTERTTWNPIGGMGDVYSVDIWHNLNDPPIWSHPFTGLPMAFRASFDVETGGPAGKLAVPSDAVIWDAPSGRWKTVDGGVEATSKVTFDYSQYFQSSWHHGEQIAMADVVYSIFQGFDMAYSPEKAKIEVSLAVTSRPFLETFRGFRILDENRLEVYVDFWHFDESYIASYASPSDLSMPWEVLLAMDTLVFEKRRGAYSDTAASRFSVPWLSLVMEKDARLVRNTFRDLAGQLPQDVFSPQGSPLVTQEQAQKRYEAAAAWFDQYKHMVISNGPYFMTRYDPPAQFAELTAFRESTYPFRPGNWLFGAPPEILILDVQAEPVSAGSAATVKVQVQGPGELGLRYLLVDPATGSVLTSGEATRSSDQQFVVELGSDVTGDLEPRFYQLVLAAHSDELSRVKERRVDLEVKP